MSVNLFTCRRAEDSRNSDTAEPRDFRGAAILDQSGKEIPITSEMVNRALNRASDFLWPTVNTCNETYASRQSAN